MLDRDVDGAVVLPAPGKGAGVTTYIASGGGRGLGQAVSGIGDSIAAKLQTTNTATDLAPLPKKDPVGSIEFYAILFAGLGAALGATVFGRILGTVDTSAKFVERSVVLVLYAGLLAGLITLWIDSALEAVTVGPWAVFGVLWLTGVAIGGAVTGVAALGGTIAALVMTLALVILGNTSSGGPLGIHVLNDFFQTLYYVFPQGDALDLLRSVQYFDGAAVAAPIIRLGIWAVAGILLTLTAMLIRNRREAAARPKGGLRREHGPRPAAGPSDSRLESAAVTPTRHRSRDAVALNTTGVLDERAPSTGTHPTHDNQPSLPRTIGGPHHARQDRCPPAPAPAPLLRGAGGGRRSRRWGPAPGPVRQAGCDRRVRAVESVGYERRDRAATGPRAIGGWLMPEWSPRSGDRDDGRGGHRDRDALDQRTRRPLR